MLSRSATWQIMMYTLASLSLLLAAGDYALGAASFGTPFLVLGLGLVPFTAWSSRRHRRAAVQAGDVITMRPRSRPADGPRAA